MSHRRSATWLLIAASSAGVVEASRAGELVVGAETSVRYDSNVGRTENNEKDDGIADLGPTVRLRENAGTLKYDVYYAPAYLQYFTHSDELSTWRHYARAQASYDLDERTTFSLADRFYYTPSVVEAFIDSGGAADPTSTLGTKKYLFNDASIGAARLFTSRLRGTLQLTNSIYEPKNDDDVSSATWGGSTDLLYALTPTDRIGGGLGINQQKYESSLQPATKTRFYQLFGTWVHDFDPTWNFAISAGPTLIDPEDPDLGGQTLTTNPLPIVGDEQNFLVAGCPERGGEVIFDASRCGLSQPQELRDTLEDALVAGGVAQPAAEIEAQQLLVDASQNVVLTNTASSGSAKSKVTYFASASMTKSWRNWEATLSYTRSAGSSSGYGTSNILDTVSAVGVWQPSPLWYFSLTGRWDQRETASKQSVVVATVDPQGVTFLSTIGPITIPNVANLNGLTTAKVDSNDALRDFSVLLYGQRRITKRLTVFGRASYFDQKAKGDVSRGRDFKDAIVSLGVRYEFTPIEIPFL